jgi:anhydro-N-acetylmuramic acid kinase
MARFFRHDGPHLIAPRRRVVGVLVSSGCKEVAATVVEIGAADARPGILVAKTARVPEEASSRFGQLSAAATGSLATLASLRHDLADIQATLIREVVAEAPRAESEILAVGVHDPGLWSFAPGSGKVTGYVGLCDAARLAEVTGLSMIDAFPDRDLAQGGLGGPLMGVAEWMLLKDPLHNQVLLDIGQTARMTLLPAARNRDAVARIVSFDVGPGTRLLDTLTHRLTNGQQRFDPGGRLAVQGRRMQELIDHWMRDPYFDRPLPRWHPRGVRPERFLTEALRMAVASSWSVRDLLCTATHFIAEAIVSALRRRLPDDLQPSRIVVTGGGQHNGMLLREIGARAPDLALIRLSDLDFPDESLEPAAVAVLAALHLDQTPANGPTTTGAATPRVLGRLTPGSPPNWQHLVRVMTNSHSASRAVRNAG